MGRQRMPSRFHLRPVEGVSPTVKYGLFFFNLLLSLVGGGFLGVGIYSHLLSNDTNSLSNWSTNPAILFMASGSILFILFFCGCVGALRENITLLKVFAYGMGLIFILQIAGGALALFFRERVKEEVGEKMVEAIKLYHITNKQTDLDDAIETVQTRWKCCGGQRSRDWVLYNKYHECTKELYSSALLSACGAPPTCCQKNGKTDTQCGYKVFTYPNITSQERTKNKRFADRDNIIYPTGCVTAIGDWIKQNYLNLGIVALSLCVVQIIGICTALNMIDQIKDIIATLKLYERNFS